MAILQKIGKWRELHRNYYLRVLQWIPSRYQSTLRTEMRERYLIQYFIHGLQI